MQTADLALYRPALQRVAITKMLQQLSQVLKAHPGTTEVRLKLVKQDKTILMRLDNQLRVTPSPPLMADLKALLGPSCIPRRQS